MKHFCKPEGNKTDTKSTFLLMSKMTKSLSEMIKSESHKFQGPFLVVLHCTYVESSSTFCTLDKFISHHEKVSSGSQACWILSQCVAV